MHFCQAEKPQSFLVKQPPRNYDDKNVELENSMFTNQKIFRFVFNNLFVPHNIRNGKERQKSNWHGKPLSVCLFKKIKFKGGNFFCPEKRCKWEYGSLPYFMLLKPIFKTSSFKLEDCYFLKSGDPLTHHFMTDKAKN